jgi:hexosaminidase
MQASKILTEFNYLVDQEQCSANVCLLDVSNPEGQLSQDVNSESYTITFSGGEAEGCKITCQTAYGCMRGLYTFLDMIDPVEKLRVPQSFGIADKPQFSHRGLLIDTSRHYIPVDLILDHIRVMAMTKMNVLHWHIVDDHSFPLKFDDPDLERLSDGAYDPSAVYTSADVRRIVDLANQFGIRVIPEIDIPGHTESWTKGHPELWSGSGRAINPTVESNYAFLEKVLSAVKRMFDSDIYAGLPVIHLGGDEVWDGWDSPEIKKWMAANNMREKAELVSFWMGRLMQIANDLGIKMSIWNDFLKDVGNDISRFGDGGDNPITFQVWQGNFPETVALANAIKRDIVYSSEFYLDHLYKSWMDFYKVDLTTDSKRVIGGEACMWTENVDASNMFPRVWPRAAAVAERLWVGGDAKNNHHAVARLARWRCRMIKYFGFPNIEPVSSQTAQDPDFVNDTVKEEWWCRESDPRKSRVEQAVNHHSGTSVDSEHRLVFVEAEDEPLDTEEVDDGVPDEEVE